jgi:hypothetical protein
MQAASNLHDQVRNAFLGEAQNIFDNATAFDAGDNMFDLNARGRENPIEEFVTDTQRLAFRVFWLPGDDPFRLVALKARVFIERGVARITDRSLVGLLFLSCILSGPVRLRVRPLFRWE